MPLFKGDPSKLKYRKRTQISKPAGVLVKCPENVLKIKEISTQKLWYELFFSQSYIAKRTDETLYLHIPDLHISGSGYVHYNPNLPNAEYNRQRKCKRINNQLYVPIPMGFEGIIRKKQFLGFLKIFSPTRSVVSLIDHAETTISTSSGVYNSSGFAIINGRRL